MALLRIPVTSLDHVLGDDDAAVTIVEYGDYECPFCAAAQPVVKQILARYGRNLRFVFRHFPLVEMHPHAEPAAETAEFAGGQGLFWPMHDAIFANQHRLNIPLLIALAASLKLSPIALRDALADSRFVPKIQADFVGGVRSGVNATPTFFVNGVRFDLPLGVAGFPAAIDATMRGAGLATNASSPVGVTALTEDGSLPGRRPTRPMFQAERG
jgi:protein-disulfide isomerase